MGPGVEEEDELQPTEQVCGQCEDDLIFEEDVIIVEVMSPRIVDGRVELIPVMDELGNFAYDVYFLHYKCWEEILEEWKEEIADTPPVVDQDQLLQCCCCAGSIREYETVMTTTLGELTRSKRSPSGGGHGLHLERNEAPDVLCIWCLSMINTHWLTFWEEPPTIQGECEECQHLRCWRGFDCECTCHDEGTT